MGGTGTLVFDGDCGFCTRTAAFLERRSDCTVVAGQRLDLDAVGLTAEQVGRAAWWLQDGHEPLGGARAVARAAQSCRGGLLPALGRLIDLPPVRPLARLVYALVARNRHRLSRLIGAPACAIDDSSARRSD